MRFSRALPPSLCALGFAILFAASCADRVEPTGPAALSKATGGGGGKNSDPTVSSTNPSFGLRATTLDVRVFGSGFDNGTVAEFALQGEVNQARVRTNSTRYVSASEVIANITIAESADLALYDVVVTTTRGKKGVAIELFEVVPETAISATFTFASSSSGGSVFGDGLDSLARAHNGNASIYKYGGCGVDARVFAGKAVGGTGDGYLQTYDMQTKDRTCAVYPRKMGAVYQGGSDWGHVVVAVKNIRDIAPGTTELRWFSARINGSRCWRLTFDESVGSQPAAVTRVDEYTWSISSTTNAAGKTLAFCHDDGTHREVAPFSFTISIRGGFSVYPCCAKGTK